MEKNQISIDYDPKGDMLSVIFGAKGRKGKGYELNDYIYIRIDPSSYEPLGLTVLSYSKIITLKEIPLSFWDDLKQQEKEMMLMILSKEPVNHFLQVKDSTIPIPVSTFKNPSLQDILAA
ncbi:MAG: hypothetical protein QG641_110 [Candidatus Poribacteria bacterium]|nr:hypothetical protein [Candidatus Poribacteria bacterium]MDQ1326830.1 hypothetical protein [Candidatus Poribacteria bacterium]